MASAAGLGKLEEQLALDVADLAARTTTHGHKLLQSVEYFDGHVWHDAPSLTKCYDGCSAMTYEGKIYLTGAASFCWTDTAGHATEQSSSVECYDPSVGRWMEVALSDSSDVPRLDEDAEQSPPAFPSGVPAGVLDGKMCILDSDRDELGQFWCFDPEDSSWERLPRSEGSHKYRRRVGCVLLS